ncbi:MULTISPECIES: hypothetical protein [unclassified Bradyrhizobium]|jgi:hypothetical protein|nr:MULTISPECIES: hypothetical protein [unclassified Bradyrhizobium]
MKYYVTMRVVASPALVPDMGPHGALGNLDFESPSRDGAAMTR